MTKATRSRWIDVATAAIAVAAIALSVWRLYAVEAGVRIEPVRIGDAPATVYRPATGAPGPAVVIAHGFSGSQELMQSFALAFARAGYAAVTFDFLGHGRNPDPLTGDLGKIEGATERLVAQTRSVTAFARGVGDGRIAILGHSMASDIVARVAKAEPDIAATIAVSMFSPAVTATTPKNLLVVVGAFEGPLKAEALRVVGLVSGPDAPRDGVTYGSFANGTARRAAFSAGVEHVGVLFAQASLAEARGWLDGAFARQASLEPVDGRGPWILLLLAGVVLLARPLRLALPVASAAPQGAGLSWRKAWPAVVGPAIATPLLLRVVPTHFLPIIVGDYLAAHFALYGALVAAGALWLGRAKTPAATSPRTSWPKVAIAALMVAGYGVFVLGSAIDATVTSFEMIAARVPLVVALLIGTSSYFLANEWLTRGEGAGRGLHAASQVAFLGSLGLAVALNPGELFFLLILVPVIVPFFIVTGLFSAWSYRRTGHPVVPALGAAALFAWGVGVTFPMLAG